MVHSRPRLFNVERARSHTGLSVVLLNSKLNGIRPLIDPVFVPQHWAPRPLFGITQGFAQGRDAEPQLSEDRN